MRVGVCSAHAGMAWARGLPCQRSHLGSKGHGAVADPTPAVHRRVPAVGLHEANPAPERDPVSPGTWRREPDTTSSHTRQSAAAPQNVGALQHSTLPGLWRRGGVDEQVKRSKLASEFPYGSRAAPSRRQRRAARRSRRRSSPSTGVAAAQESSRPRPRKRHPHSCRLAPGKRGPKSDPKEKRKPR